MNNQPTLHSFSLGQTVITANALNQLHPEDITVSLARHARRDWGDLCAEDVEENDRCLREGARLLSAY